MIHHPIFDAHLDLAMNVVRGRDITQPASEQPVVENEIATVGLPDLRAGNVTRVCATIFCEPARGDRPGYHDAQGAHDQAMEQLGIYQSLIARGELSRVGQPGAIGATILLEGADGIRTPADVQAFHNAGVRIVGLAWQRTRYAGGTACPGPLTEEGRDLVKTLDEFRILHDASHLAEESFWELLDRTPSRVIASHSNCRLIVGKDPGERHLSDDMICAIIARGGVIGINFYDRFLLPHTEYGRRRASLSDVVAHFRHVCDLAGNANHVAIGTDMDGGLGREQVPVEIQTSADLAKVPAALRDAGFTEYEVDRITFGNWADLLDTLG